MTKNDALMARARRVDPQPSNPFKGFADSPEAQEILTSILETSPFRRADSGAVPMHKPRRGLHHRSLVRRTVAFGVMAAFVLGIMTVVTPDRPGRGGQTGWDAELVSIAEASPRYLIADQEWSIASVDEFSGQSGEMMFQNGPGALMENSTPGLYWIELSWSPASEHDELVKDREASAENSGAITIADQAGILFQDTDSAPIGSTIYALWLDGGHSLQLRSDVIPTIEGFTAVANELRSVDVDAWLSAMPASIVKPEERGNEIDEILARLPAPANLDVQALKDIEMVRNDHSFGYEVRNAVVCSWVQQWVDATKVGNDRGAEKAAAALAWPGWAKSDDHGQWSSFVSDVATAMKTKHPVNGNQSVPIGVTYQRHLGCPEG